METRLQKSSQVFFHPLDIEVILSKIDNHCDCEIVISVLLTFPLIIICSLTMLEDKHL